MPSTLQTRCLHAILVIALAAGLFACNSLNERMGFRVKRLNSYTWQMEPINPDEKIVQAVASSRPDERREAINWLARPDRCVAAPVVRLLTMIVRDDPDPTVRASAARALGQSANPASVEPLVAAAGDPNSFVRLDAVRSLAGKSGPAVCQALLTALSRDADPQVRGAAAAGLAGFPERRVVDGLVVALKDREFVVVYYAEQSLVRLTGHSCEYDPAAWTRWVANVGPDGALFANAGRPPANADHTGPNANQRMRQSLRRAWYWWQADSKPGN